MRFRNSGRPLVLALWLAICGVIEAQNRFAAPAVTCPHMTLGNSNSTAVVYVLKGSGSQTACGNSLDNACLSIEAGVAACEASTHCAVLVMGGEYRLKSSLQLPDGVRLFGGCAPPSEQTVSALSALDAPSHGVPAIVLNGTRDSWTGIESFILIGSDAAASANDVSSRPSGVIYASGSTFTLSHVRIIAGSAANGARGADGLKGQDVKPGGPLPCPDTEKNCGLFLVNKSVDPEAQAKSVSDIYLSRYGNSDLHGHCGENPSPGVPAPGILKGGPWTEQSAPWQPVHAAPGGAGGGVINGGGGGGGGAGGVQGGASIGILLIQSHVTLVNTTFSWGRPGLGGAGGNGGDGGKGRLIGSIEFGMGGPGAGGAGGPAGPGVSVLLDADSSAAEPNWPAYSTGADGGITYWPAHGGQRGTYDDPGKLSCSGTPKAPDGAVPVVGHLVKSGGL